MASDASFVDYVRDQIGAGPITFRKMFGEYAIYFEEKLVALLSDDQLFMKPTDAGRALIEKTTGEVVEAPPYPGAKNSYLIGSELDDRDFLAELVRVTAAELPVPKPKKPKAAGAEKGTGKRKS